MFLGLTSLLERKIAAGQVDGRLGNGLSIAHSMETTVDNILSSILRIYVQTKLY